METEYLYTLELWLHYGIAVVLARTYKVANFPYMGKFILARSQTAMTSNRYNCPQSRDLNYGYTVRV